MKILLDPGHGSDTPGKRSPDGLFREYEYNRLIASRVIAELNDCGFDAQLLVPEIYDVPLFERCRRKWHSASGWSAYTTPGILESHDRGCIATDCIRMLKDSDKKVNAKVQAYKTFGFHEDWLSEYFSDPKSFWDINSLGTAQVDGFKMWLKHAEIDSKYQAAYNIQTEEDGAWRVFIANDRVIEDFDGNILARKAVKDKYQAKMLRKEARMLCRLHHMSPARRARVQLRFTERCLRLSEK